MSSKSVERIREIIEKAVNGEQLNADDLRRINSTEWWINVFGRDAKSDEEAAEKLIECLKWRVSFGVQGIGTLELHNSLCENFIYFHGCDLKGNNILWINWNRYEYISTRRNAERLLVYWLDRHTMETQGMPFTVISNCNACDYKDVDTDFLKFIFICLTDYYPNCVTDFLLFSAPTVTQNDVIRSRDAANKHSQISIINVDKDVDSYIPFKFLPKYMGGADDYVFVMHQLPYCIHSRGPYVDKRDGSAAGGYSDAADTGPPHSKKSVSFKDSDSTVNNATEAFLVASADQVLLEQNAKGEFAAELTLENRSPYRSQMFKIKTTAPHKFRVRPTLAVLKPNAKLPVKIVLEKGYEKSYHVERFLITSVLTEKENVQKFSTISAGIAPADRCEVKLSCLIRSPDDGTANNCEGFTSTGGHTVNKDMAIFLAERELAMLKHVGDLNRQININRLIIFVMVLLQIIGFIFLYSKTLGND